MTADPMTILRARFATAITSAMGDNAPANPDPLLSPAKNPEFGDYQANCAMPLAKRTGKPPREIAQSIIDSLDIADIADLPTITGPGFINIRLLAGALGAGLEEMDTPALGVEHPAKPETVVVDLCGVNLAKQMHVGHLRATVIGDGLARLFARLGHNAIRQNHFGDWGLPIAMVTHAVKLRVDAGELSLDALTLASLERMYKDAQTNCAADLKGLAAVRRFGLGPKAEAELEEQVAGAEEHLGESKRALVSLQSGDEAYVRVWEKIARVTLDACFENCRRLHADVTDEHTAGESTYRADLPEVVADLESRGIAEESDGALVVRVDNEGIKAPCLIRKSDGGFLYATTDISGVRRRVQELGGDRLVYAVDARQGLHFKQIFAAARRAGYASHADGSDAELFHAAFGTVLGEDGRPFKTRSGENVKLSDLIDEAVARAERAVREKNPSLSDDEVREVAEAVGIGAIKYADLSSDRIKDYVFSFDRMLAFEGNTGPYLQYALVRIRSIFRKASECFGEDVASDARLDACAFALTEQKEKAIALELLKYQGVLHGAAETCELHRICGYLYDLAGAFSSFFAACPVLQAEEESVRDSRLRLCRLTGRVLEDGLGVLGIRTLERM